MLAPRYRRLTHTTTSSTSYPTIGLSGDSERAVICTTMLKQTYLYFDNSSLAHTAVPPVKAPSWHHRLTKLSLPPSQGQGSSERRYPSMPDGKHIRGYIILLTVLGVEWLRLADSISWIVQIFHRSRPIENVLSNCAALEKREDSSWSVMTPILV